MIGPKVFSTPKPVRLLTRMIEIGAGKNDIVMDFFAGSGATGHAVLELNKKLTPGIGNSFWFNFQNKLADKISLRLQKLPRKGCGRSFQS